MTTQECTYCGEPHYKDQKYFHPYTQKTISLAIEITDLEDLTEEIKKRINKKTKEILEEIGLERGQLIAEELTQKDGDDIE